MTSGLTIVNAEQKLTMKPTTQPHIRRNIQSLYAGLLLITALPLHSADQVDRFEILDRADNRLFTVEYLYNGDQQLTGRVVYDMDGSELRRTAVRTDGAGSRLSENYIDHKKDTIFRSTQTNIDNNTRISLDDQYHKDGTVLKGSYSQTGNQYTFADDLGLSSHSMVYNKTASGLIADIEVRDGKNRLTHKINVAYLGRDAVVPRLQELGNHPGLRYIGKNKLELTLNFDSRQSVKIDMLNMAGQSIKSIVNSDFPGGVHGVMIDLGKPEVNGVYLLRTRAGGKELVNKILLVR